MLKIGPIEKDHMRISNPMQPMQKTGYPNYSLKLTKSVGVEILTKNQMLGPGI